MNCYNGMHWGLHVTGMMGHLSVCHATSITGIGRSALNWSIMECWNSKHNATCNYTCNNRNRLILQINLCCSYNLRSIHCSIIVCSVMWLHVSHSGSLHNVQHSTSFNAERNLSVGCFKIIVWNGPLPEALYKINKQSRTGANGTSSHWFLVGPNHVGAPNFSRGWTITSPQIRIN